MSTNRRMQILEHLTQRNSLSIHELSRLMNVSPSTIRRELRAMEKDGVLVRTHGGVRLHAPIQYEPPYEKRAAEQVEAKRAIAAAARSLLYPGIVIGLSGGTTCTELARQLRMVQGITVVTNAVNVAIELYGHPDIRVMLTGGFLNKRSYELVGSLVSQSLAAVHLDITFLGVSGIDPVFGFSMSDEAEVLAARALIDAADQTVILADRTKIGKRTFARLCGLDEVDLLITDPITPEQRSLLAQSSVKVLEAN